jgi:O-antigen/teichoic acid export membrane protein
VADTRKLARNYVLLSAGELLAKLLNFLAFAWLGRLLGAEHYGSLEFALALMVFFTLPADMGLGVFGAREIARNPQDAPSLLVGITMLRALLALGSLACLALLASLLPAPAELKHLLLLYGCSLLGIPLLLQWFFQGHDEMPWVALASLVRYGVFAGLVLTLLRPGMSLGWVGLIECAAVSAAALFCVAVALFRFRVRPQFPAGGWRGATAYLRQGMPIGLTELVWAFLWYIATVLAGLMVRDASLGWFGASHRILMALHTFVWLYFFNLLPSIARTFHGPRAELEKLLSASLRLTAWVGTFVALLGTVLAREALRIAYGARFSAGGPVLATLVWVIPVALASGHYRYTLIAYGRQALLLRATGCAALAVVAGCLILVPRAGTLGAAWSLLAGCLLELGLTKVYVSREIARVPILASVSRPAAAAAGAFLLHRGLDFRNPFLAGATVGLVFLGVMVVWERSRLMRRREALGPVLGRPQGQP